MKTTMLAFALALLTIGNSAFAVTTGPDVVGEDGYACPTFAAALDTANNGVMGTVFNTSCVAVKKGTKLIVTKEWRKEDGTYVNRVLIGGKLLWRSALTSASPTADSISIHLPEGPVPTPGHFASWAQETTEGPSRSLAHP